jgi:hypothetical protein
MGLASQPKLRLDAGDGRVLELHLQAHNHAIKQSRIQSQSEGLTD